jgi:hypothetical protein
MKVEKVVDKIRYTLSNDNLKEGDKVYPIASGRCTEDGGWILHNYDFRDFCTGFPNEPHTIVDLNFGNGNQGKAYEVRTDMGFSPIERYYKIVKKEENVEVKHSTYRTTREWVEIK